jgi:hypothetical protein
MMETLILLGEERRLWMMAGARGLLDLIAPLPGVYYFGSIFVICKGVDVKLENYDVRCNGLLSRFHPLVYLLNIMKRRSPAFSRR